MMKKTNILILDLAPTIGLGSSLQGILECSPNIDTTRHEYKSIPYGSDLFKSISHHNPDVIFLVLAPNHLKKTDVLFQSIHSEKSELSIIVVIKECKPDEMFALLKLGAADFLTPPFKGINVLPRLWRLLDQKRQSETLTYKLKKTIGLKQLVGESPAFLAEIKKIPLLAKCDASILIYGETGTGKELCARAIHYLSPRASKPFMPFNCGAIPTELMENEIFGHVQGAFTNASTSQPGLIHGAHRGTLFLDDIECLSLTAQAKLLRFLQEKEYRRLGSPEIHQADVRIITATNLKLEAAMREGKLRQDLYYRLNIISIMLPPLRDRREDIPLLAYHFLEKYASEFNKNVTDFAPDVIQMLVLYDWPGNVRELEHVVERAVLFAGQVIIRKADIILPSQEDTTWQMPFKEAKAKVITQFERNYIQKLLLASQGNISRAAKVAQKNRRAFWELIRKHRINVQTFNHG